MSLGQAVSDFYSDRAGLLMLFMLVLLLISPFGVWKIFELVVWAWNSISIDINVN